ncbi:hypothetical protein QTP23_31660, partial [Klebsiella michiganensis]|nr:hypothetical protein [Klebsiella michiganensis]
KESKLPKVFPRNLSAIWEGTGAPSPVLAPPIQLLPTFCPLPLTVPGMLRGLRYITYSGFRPDSGGNTRIISSKSRSSAIRKAEGSASDHSYALQLLEINFKANPLDLIYHPDCWFNDEALFHARLTTEEIGGYLMKKSGRWLNDAPDIQLVYAIPQDVYD